jgi:general L-amino acid transport system substrate-binding protein
MFIKVATLILSTLLSGLALATTPGSTIAAIQKRGTLQCGVSQSLLGFSYREAGIWKGIDVDLCRALAAAVLKDSQAVEFIPLSTMERFQALSAGHIDLLSRNTTWNYSRDTSLGISFAGIMYYDGQGFMVGKDTKIHNLDDMRNKTFCTRAATTSEQNIKAYLSNAKIPHQLLTFHFSDREVLNAYHNGSCQIYTGDRSSLAAQRQKLSNPDEHVILNLSISKEPLGPAVRDDDPQWLKLVRWTIYGLINAEELGITQANIDTFSNSAPLPIRTLLGLSEENLGASLHLDPQFIYRSIKSVGNYGEIFERNLGQHSKLKLPRGLNQLWQQQGLMYAPPFT